MLAATSENTEYILGIEWAVNRVLHYGMIGQDAIQILSWARRYRHTITYNADNGSAAVYINWIIGYNTSNG